MGRPAVLAELYHVVRVGHRGNPRCTQADEVGSVPLGSPLLGGRQSGRHIRHAEQTFPAVGLVLVIDLDMSLHVHALIGTVVGIEVEVAVEDGEFASRAQDPQHLLVDPSGVVEVPQDIAGYHEIEGSVLEFEVVRIHGQEGGRDAVRVAVFGRGPAHLLVVIDAGDIMSQPSQYHREET